MGSIPIIVFFFVYVHDIDYVCVLVGVFFASTVERKVIAFVCILCLCI